MWTSIRLSRRDLLRLAAGTLLTPAVAVAAGCGPRLSSLEPTPTPALPKLAKVRYGLATYNGFHLAAMAAAERPELLAPFGVELELFWMGSPPAVVQAVVAGALHLAPTPPEAAWPAQEKLPELVQVAALANGTPYSVLANPRVTRVADLRGQTVGATTLRGGPDTTALRVILSEHGLREADYSLLVQGGDSVTIPVGALSEQIAALKTGVILAVAHLEPQATIFRDAGLVELARAEDYPALLNVHSLVGLARRDWYTRHLETMVAFLRGWRQVTAWVYDPGNRDELIDLLARLMKVETRAAANTYERHVVASRTLPLDPRLDAGRLRQAAENQRRAGADAPPADPLRFVDNRAAERAMAGERVG